MKKILFFLAVCSLGIYAGIGPYPGGASSGGGGGSGTVTSVGVSVPSVLSVSGSPVTTSGTIALSYSGVALPVANGGTGQTSAQAAIDALLPAQGSANGKFLTSNGSASSWGTVSGTGDVVGPSSSVDGDVATMNSTTGKLIRSEAKTNIAPGTGKTTHTYTSAITGAMNDYAIGTATSWTNFFKVSGTAASVAAELDYFDIAPVSNSTTANNVLFYIHPNFGSNANGYQIGFYSPITGTTTSPGIGANAGTFGGARGIDIPITNNSTASGSSALALNGWAKGNKSIGTRGYAVATGGTAPRAYGAIGQASQDNSAEAVGGFFKIATATSGAVEDAAQSAGISTALGSDNTNTTANSFTAFDNGGSVFQVRAGGAVNIGGNAANTVNHTLNGAMNGGSLFPVRFVESLNVLPDQANITVDLGISNIFRLTATGNRTINPVTSCVDGQKFIIEHTASGGARTLTLTTSGVWSFKYGASVTTLAATTSGKTDYIGFICNGVSRTVDVIAVSDGY